MRGDGWPNLIFDDWDDYGEYCRDADYGIVPSPAGQRVIIGGLLYGADGNRVYDVDRMYSRNPTAAGEGVLHRLWMWLLHTFGLRDH